MYMCMGIMTKFMLGHVPSCSLTRVFVNVVFAKGIIDILETILMFALTTGTAVQMLDEIKGTKKSVLRVFE